MVEVVLPIGIKGIQDLIPHRYPFLLIDRITQFEPEVGISGIKTVSFTDPHLQGHFPGNPVMPGVLQIEALAQLSAVYGRLLEPDSTSVLLTEVSSARFRRQVIPGDVMKLEVKAVKRRKGFFWFEGVVNVDDTAAAHIKFSAKLG